MTPLRVNSRLLRHPLLHFFILGGLIYAAVDAWPTSPRERQPVVFSAARVQMLRNELESSLGRTPTRVQMEDALEREIEEELLFQEALRLGLDRGDSSVRGRVIESAAFVVDDDQLSDSELYEQGLALALDRHDLVVRRILIHKMRLLAKWADPGDPPSEEELARYLATHADLYELPERFTLSHVFFNRGRRGEALSVDAEEALIELRTHGVGPDDARRYGDAFPLGSTYRLRSKGQLDGTFGPGFGRLVGQLPIGRWSDPLPSSYGLHLVLLHERLAPGLPSLEKVRTQVAHRILAERAEQRLAVFLEQLRRSYEVRIEGAEG
jgi:hypothetical protein